MGRKRTIEKEPSARLARCLTEFSVTFAPGQEKGCTFGPGKIIDLDEELSPGQKLESLIRPGCVEELKSDPPMEFHVEEETEEEDNDDTDRS